MMGNLVLYPEQLLYQILRVHEIDNVVKISKGLINSICQIAQNSYDINVSHISYEAICEIVNDIVFYKHQSIINKGTIYLLNTKETLSRLETINESYSLCNDEFNFIGDIFLQII